MIAWLALSTIGLYRAGACGLPIEPDMKLADGSKPTFLYEDEPYTWRVDPTRFPSIGYTFWFFPGSQSGQRQDGALGQRLSQGILVPRNWKTFPIDVGRNEGEKFDSFGNYREPKVYGATFSKRITSPVAGGRRTSFSRFAFSRSSFLDLPGRLPMLKHHYNFENLASTSAERRDILKEFGPIWLRDKLENGGNIPPNLIVFACPFRLPELPPDTDSDGPVRVVEVYDETYEIPTEWTITDWAVDWNMDRQNIGYNPGDQFMGARALNYTHTYVTPSDPAEYVVEINMAVTLKMLATWTWYEQVRDDEGQIAGTYGPYKLKITGEAYKSSSGLGSSSAVPEIWTVRVLDKTPPISYRLVDDGTGSDPYRLYGTTGDLIKEWNEGLGMLPGNPRNQDTVVIRVLENNPHINLDDPYQALGGNVSKIQLPPGGYWGFQVSDFVNPWVCPEHYKLEERQPQSGACPQCSRPLERDFLDYTWGITQNSSGTKTVDGKGTTFRYFAGMNPADDQLKLVDSKMNGWVVEIEVVGDDPQRMGLFSRGQLSTQVLYSVQMYDYNYEKGYLCGQPGHDHGQCDCTAVNRDKFVWVEIPVDHANKTVEVYDANGRVVSGGISGSGERSDPAYSVMEITVPIEMLAEPLGWHFATTSIDYTDPWGKEHRGWGAGGRLKYFVAAGDGSGNFNAPYWIASDSQRHILNDVYPVRWSASDGLEDPIAAADLRDATVRSAKGTGLGEAVSNEDWATWPSLANSFGHPAEPWPLRPAGNEQDPENGVFYPPEFGDRNQWGRYGHIIAVDDDVPTLKLNVREGSLRRTFSFGDIAWGDYKRKAYRECLRTNETVFTQTNKDTLREPKDLEYLLTTRLFTPGENVDIEWEFKDTAQDGYRHMGQKIQDGSFNPWCYRLQFTGDTEQYALWTSEDIRLVFDLFTVGTKICARDNINEFNPGAQPGGISTPFNAAKQTYDTFAVVDGELQFEQEMSYVFRSTNVENPPRDCFVEVKAADLTLPVLTTKDSLKIKTGGPYERLLKVFFYVARTGMTRVTLEEKEK